MLEAHLAQKVHNNKICKALFVNLRPLDNALGLYTQKNILEVQVCRSLVNK